jgi:hypothetical protein
MVRQAVKTLHVLIGLGLLGAWPARADFVSVAYNGITPYPPDSTTVSFPPSPVVLDRVRPPAPRLGTGETIVDSRGRLSATLLAAPSRDSQGNTFAVGPFVANAILDDTACFFGTGIVTLRFETHATGILPPTNTFNDKEYAILATNLVVGRGVISSHTHDQAQFALPPLPGSTVPTPNVPFPIDLVVDDTFSVTGTATNPDMVHFTFQMTAEGFGGASLDVSQAQLGFVLPPPGFRVCTDGGFLQATVPEPSGLLLLATGFAGLVGYSWRRKRHAARQEMASVSLPSRSGESRFES